MITDIGLAHGIQFSTPNQYSGLFGQAFNLKEPSKQRFGRFSSVCDAKL